MRVSVIGGGKMGLPLACVFAANGATVTVCDIRQDTVDAIMAGQCPIDEPGVPELMGTAVASGALTATTDTEAAVATSTVVVVIVPALLTSTNDADLSALTSVARQISRAMRPGTLITFETTVPVGSTRRHFLPLLEHSGLRAGVDFDLAFSPERVKSQLVLDHLTSTPKVVGGINARSAERASDFYATYLGAVAENVGTLEAAEMVKVAGMVYRDVNIALSNELARYAELVGVDFDQVIRLANTDGEAYLLSPGIGVGGHCTPVYPYFLIQEASRLGSPATLAERARRINDDQASYSLNRVERVIGSLSGRRVLILGLAFRPQVKEYILSPAFLLREELDRRGAEVLMHDPLYSDEEIRGFGFVPVADLATLNQLDLVVLNTAHAPFRNLDFVELAKTGLQAVLDGRNLWDPAEVLAAGISYIGIGKADPVDERVPSVPISRPVVDGLEADAAASVIRSGWLAQGPQVAAFEAEFAQAVGARHAVAVSSGTTALHLALRSVGVGPGDEVVTVSHSFIATANAIRYCGATPVFVDIEPDTFNMDPHLVEAAIGERTRAILAVHQMGMPCDLESLVEVARRHGLPLVEDAACAIGSEILGSGGWERIGAPIGDVACFSFHPRKVLTTGEGGMITTRDEAIASRCRHERSHGLVPAASRARHAGAARGDEYETQGFNYRMTDIQAAIGREQLKRLPRIVARRRELADRYRTLLGDVPGLVLPVEPAFARTNWQSYCVRLPESVGQAAAMTDGIEAGIATRSGIMCSHREPVYADLPLRAPLPRSEEAQDRCLILPLYPGMTDVDQDRVVNWLRRICRSEA